MEIFPQTTKIDAADEFDQIYALSLLVDAKNSDWNEWCKCYAIIINKKEFAVNPEERKRAKYAEEMEKHGVVSECEGSYGSLYELKPVAFDMIDNWEYTGMTTENKTIINADRGSVVVSGDHHGDITTNVRVSGNKNTK